MSSAIDLDPTILKALGYFRSSNLESPEKLKTMLNDAILNSKNIDSKGLHSGDKSYLFGGSKVMKLTGNIDIKKQEPSNLKRHLDKIQDSNEFNLKPTKQQHLSSTVLTSSSKDSFNSLIPPNGAFGKPLTSLSSVSPDDFALEMAGLVCATCRKMTVASGNKLVECQECHNLYHQDCHKPIITDADISDPRHVWYCSNCQQSIKQLNNSVQPQLCTSASAMDLSNEKSTKTKTKTTVPPFKRTELKSTLSNANHHSAPPLSGWASLSGKPSSSGHKLSEDGGRTSDLKHSLRKNFPKEKPKPSKNHSKNLLSSDVWAEALGAKTSTNDKTKYSSKSSTNNNSTKHLSLSTVPWLSTPGSNISNKPKNPSSLNSNSSYNKLPFPKPTASSLTKSLSTHDNATKQVEVMKKKAAVKQQQKRSRI